MICSISSDFWLPDSKCDMRWQMDFFGAASTSVVMRSDAGLVHAGDQCRAAGGTDCSSDVGLSETYSLFGQAIKVRGINGLFAVACKVGGHVVRNDPDNVWTFVGKATECMPKAEQAD